MMWMFQPQCRFDVHLKTGQVNTHIERSGPKSRFVEVIVFFLLFFFFFLDFFFGGGGGEGGGEERLMGGWVVEGSPFNCDEVTGGWQYIKVQHQSPVHLSVHHLCCPNSIWCTFCNRAW